ncbi:MAG: CHAP domain-containing protein, partial [Oscillospiraceae bacterium]|nr:CHAP domain-containing protein [Oscillospiraceae bacterium]
DHVGIVERIENGYVYTIEGNSSDSVRQRSYLLNSNRVFGYGIVAG